MSTNGAIQTSPDGTVRMGANSPLVYNAIVYAIMQVLGYVGDQVLIVNGATESLLQSELRLKTMDAPLLDVAIHDFFADNLPRLPNESNSAYLTRALALLFQARNTQSAIQLMLQQLTGQPAHLINPDSPADVGGFSAASNPSSSPIGGMMVYQTLVGPPAYLGYDQGDAPLRFANPNGVGTVVVGGYANNPDVPQTGYAWQAFIDTTWPVEFGAQGNPVNGFLTILASNPPTEYGATGILGAPSVYTNISAGGFAACSNPQTVIDPAGNSQSIYGTVTGDPTTALFNSRGLTPADLAAGQATVLAAINSLRMEGVTLWARCLPAAFLQTLGFTS